MIPGRRNAVRLLLVLAVPPFLVFALLSGTVLFGLSKDKRTWNPSDAVRWDAGRLDPVRAHRVIRLTPDTTETLFRLRGALTLARDSGFRISISGARHSMGGQSVFPNGLIVEMPGHNGMRLDSSEGPEGKNVLLKAQAGAHWSAILPYLDAHGYSIRIMQSNDIFTVGGTLSVNAHGWQHNLPPFGSSVEAFRILTADGIVRNCSRTENPELFSLVIGGYGLFGIVLEADLRVLSNALYRAERLDIPAQEYPARFSRAVDGDAELGLVYGRLSVAPSNFLRHALLTRYRLEPKPAPRMAERNQPDGFLKIKRGLFLAGVGNGFGKEVRWRLEKWLGGERAPLATRNAILNRSIDLFENHDSSRTQILHEYFIPPSGWEAFLSDARRIIPEHHGDLLNVTVRNLKADRDAFLAYALQDVFSLVMLFSHSRDSTGDRNMKVLTQVLIDAALKAGGCYYLPYRRHASRAQFLRAYPMAAEFFGLKRKYDPEEIFQNLFYREYGRE